MLARQLSDGVMGGVSVLATGAAGTSALLSAVASLLAGTRTRVLRVDPPLDLAKFLERVSPLADLSDDEGLERGFTALTSLDDGCDRIVLLLDDAHLLPPSILRYVELALRARPQLQAVFAGRPELADTLALAGFAGLSQRLSLRIDLSAPPCAAPAALPAPKALPAALFVGAPAPLSAQPPRRHGPALAIAGGAVAASLVLAGMLRPSSPPSTAAAEVQPSAVAAMPQEQAGAWVVELETFPAAPATLPAPPQQGVASPVEPPRADDVSGAAVAGDPPPATSADAAPEAIPSVPEETGGQAAAPPAARPPAPPAQPGRTAAVPVSATAVPLSAPAVRRCRDVILRLQLEEVLSDGDRTFLRNSCR